MQKHGITNAKLQYINSEGLYHLLNHIHLLILLNLSIGVPADNFFH
jgi:hypothetical protein